MKRIIGLTLLVAIAGFAAVHTSVPALDDVVEVNWGLAGDSYYYLGDATMKGLVDTSVAYRIPSGASSFDIWVQPDTGTTSILEADDDSFLLWMNLLTPGGGTADWILGDDTLCKVHSADSFYNWLDGYYHTSLQDTFWTPLVFAPSDSIATPRFVGTGNRWNAEHTGIQFIVRVTDTTGLDDTRVYFRFNSQINSLKMSADKSGH